MIQLDRIQAQKQLQAMHCTIEKRYVLPTLWYCSKFLRSICQGLYVEEPGIQNIKKLIGMKERVVLLPTYKSFADLFILLYTLNSYKMETPFTIGNMEDIPHIALIEKLLKGVGYVKASRSRDQSIQESYLTQALIREILVSKKNLLVMFQNDQRMRSGRFTQPTVADISIEWLMQVYLSSLQREGQNVYLIPVAINYDRLFEIRNLATEIVSGSNDPSLFDVGRMISQQSDQKMGKVYMTFGEAINMRDYLNKNKLSPSNQANLDSAALQLTTDLVL